MSPSKDLKKDLIGQIKLISENKIQCQSVTSRSDAISELSQRDFAGVFFHCEMPPKDLEMILKYLSTNEYFLSNLFFASQNFETFKDILNQLNFPKIHLINLPISTKEIAEKINRQLYPVDTKKVDNNCKINLEFLKVFIDSTKKVFQEFCGLKTVEHKRPYLLNSNNIKEFSILGKIPLKSDRFQGNFNIGFEKEFYIKLVNKILQIESNEIGEDTLDFAAEIMNMTYGQAKLILNESGYNFQKVFPSYEFKPIFKASQNHIVVVPIETEIGMFYIEVEVIQL